MANDAYYFAIRAKHGAAGIAHVDGCISLHKYFNSIEKKVIKELLSAIYLLDI